MDWQDINRFLATVFGLGNISQAPGTIAAIGAGLAYYLFPVLSHPFIITVVFVTGVISCEIEGRRSGLKDDSTLVIDEIVGMWLTFMFIDEPSLALILLGFCLFRLFDIWKPLFIGTSQRLPGGIGVMLDDVLAAVPANLILQLLLYIL